MTMIITVTRGIPHDPQDGQPTDVVPFEVEGDTFRQCFMQADELATAVGEKRGFKLDQEGRASEFALSMVTEFGQKDTQFEWDKRSEALRKEKAWRETHAPRCLAA